MDREGGIQYSNIVYLGLFITASVSRHYPVTGGVHLKGKTSTETNLT